MNFIGQVCIKVALNEKGPLLEGKLAAFLP